MKTKKLFSLLLLSIFYSCQESDNAIYTPLPEAKVLTDCELIFRFDTEYPLQVQEKDSLLFLSKHSVNHVFLSPTSIINFTSKKQSYDDTRRSSRDNELLQRAQSDL